MRRRPVWVSSFVALFAAQWIYFVVWEARYGRTPGKMAVGVRVVTTSGGRSAGVLPRSATFFAAADLLPTGYVAGVAAMALTSRFQRLGDLVAGTMVVVPERARVARALELSPPGGARRARGLPEHVTLDADERAAIELFLRRRHNLGKRTRDELAAMIAQPIGERLGYSHRDPSRLLAIVYDRAVNAGRVDASPSSWHPYKKRPKRQAGGAR